MKALCVGVMFCVGLMGQTSAKAPAKTAAAVPAKKATTGAAKTVAPGPSSRLMHPELAKSRAPELYRVKFTTSKGDFVVEVHRDWAPLGADRFYNLVRVGYFNGDAFYRVVPTWVQFGASPYPEVSRAWSSSTIKDDPKKEGNKAGTIVFATAGTDKRTTQVFINFQDNGMLDNMGFTPFGTVTEGLDLAKGLYAGYGEMQELGGPGPSQRLTMEQGKAYLDKSFPQLDHVVSAKVIFPEAAPVAAKKGTTTATKAPAKK
jgi:peptidyl-prolyl cis-trans isomerase A (cyclophilin A)